MFYATARPIAYGLYTMSCSVSYTCVPTTGKIGSSYSEMCIV